MTFNFYLQTEENHKQLQQHSPEKRWRFTYLGGYVPREEKPRPANSFSLVEVDKGTWVQIVRLPRHDYFPIVGVAVGTYLLVLGKTDRGAVRVQVIGQQVTLSASIAEQVYVRPLYFTN